MAAIVRRLTDRALGRLMHLPPETGAYTVESDLRVPMRDGVTLSTDHYAPHTDRPRGTVLVRSPYGNRPPMTFLSAALFAARGYHVVLQQCRGTFASGGAFEPMVNEARDAQDTVVWLRERPWYTGTFATLGPSYLGFTQWALLADPPEDLVTAIVTVGPHDFAKAAIGSGALSLSDFLGWTHTVVHQEQGGMFASMRRAATASKVLRPALGPDAPLGLAAGARAVLGGHGPWYYDWIAHPDRDDPYWAPYDHTEALSKVTVPVLLFAGWQDLFLDQTMQQYETLLGRGVPVGLSVGPWTHLETTVNKGPAMIARESLAWLAQYLDPAPSGSARPDAVRYFVTGADEWRTAPVWPPATTQQSWYPRGDGGLGADVPQEHAESGERTVRFDPLHPTPSIGGRVIPSEGGYKDTTEVEARQDMLTFTSAPLTEDLDIAGVPVAELLTHADLPNADLFVRISQVGPDGKSRNVSDGYVRTDKADVPDVVRLALDPIAHRFARGTSIRLCIAGGWYPQFSRNPGTGEAPATAEGGVPVTRSVTPGPSTRLLLPVVAAG